MTFLELCRALRREAGVAGSGPLTVVGQTGELARLVDWIKDAYVDVMDLRNDWDFLRNDFSLALTTSVQTYAKTTVSNLANWKVDSLRCYQDSIADERWMVYRPWTEFRDLRLYSTIRTQTGRPQEFTIKPDKSLMVWPIPDNVGSYTVTGEYYRTAPELVNDSDEPAFDRFQMVIVWNALMRYAAWVESPTAYARAQKEYNRLIMKLQKDETQEITLGGALA
jgi:hypothetical protein